MDREGYRHTEYDIKRVGRGYRRFNGELFAFYAKATMVGSFADNGYEKHVAEVKEKADQLRSVGYKVRVVPTNTGEYLIYTHGERRGK